MDINLNGVLWCACRRKEETAMLLPEGVLIDGKTGAVAPETGRCTKRLSHFLGIFYDRPSHAANIASRCDPTVYEVVEYRRSGSDLFFGTTTIEPGKVGDEFYMTPGHFHQRRDMGEVYYTQSGEGLLLLQSRSGEISVINMRPGICAFIPPDWAHRSINTGDEKLVFVWVCNVETGHDYTDISERGMNKLVVERHGKVELIDNPDCVRLNRLGS